MKKKFLKLGIAGVLLSGFLINSALAQNDAETSNQSTEISQEYKSKINSNKMIEAIKEVVREQQFNRILKEKAQYSFKVVEPIKEFNIVKDREEKKSILNENHAKTIGTQCKIALSYDIYGNSPKLTSQENILELTMLKNERQKEIMRYFVALHESFHCEFAAIENPIRIKGKSEEFNKKINYYLKDIHTIPIPEVGMLAYMDTLSENFSDIGTIGVLAKKYGIEDKDFKYVANVVHAQRYAHYLTTPIDSHFTHKSLETILKPQNLNFLVSSYSKNYQDVVLDIANQSLQQMLAERKDLTEKMTSEVHFQGSILMSMARKINYELATDEQRAENSLENPWKDGVSRGITSKVAHKLLEDGHFKSKGFKFMLPGEVENRDKIVEYISDRLSFKSPGKELKTEINEYSKYMKEFTDFMNEQKYEQLNNSEFLLPTKNNIVQNLQILQKKFSQSISSNGNNQTPLKNISKPS